MENEWSWRFYTEDDYGLLAEWAKYHGIGPLPPEWLSDTGFILSNPVPSIMCFLYHDPSCRVGFIEHVHTRPGMTVTPLKDGLIYAVNEPFRQASIDRGIDAILVRSPRAAARVVLHTPGWFVNERGLASLAYIYSREGAAVYEAM